MPQMISRNTVLLQGAGRTNIEYSAGPNINITNDVISGRDWSNEIAKGGASAVSSHLSAGDHIDLNTNSGGITTISVTGDFYSAGDNINITNNVISGKDWTQDIVDTVESAISANQPQEYSAGSNINIENHIISGKDWSNEIDQKLDTSAFQETISSFATKYELSSTSSEIIDIISATSGQGGGSCPWISGGKDYGSATVQLNFGDTIPVFSSWGLSADHNHYIWMKGAYIRLPDGSEFLPISSFSGYTASMASNMENNWNYTNSAYSMAINNTHNKLDNSAFSAYTAAHSTDDNTPYSGGSGIEVNDHVISFTGEAGSNYSAGDNINITNNVISGKDWNGEISAASSILNQMIASGDNVAYSAGSNIDVTNHVISGKDWTNEIASSTSGKLDTSWTAGKDFTPYSAGANIDVTNHVISGKDWNDTIDEHIASAISGIEVPSSKPVSGTSGIKIEETENSVIFSISGDVGKTYSAGDNIYISNQNVISGRNWTSNINAATSGKLDSTWTAGKDVTPYSAGSNINITNHVVSGKDWTSDIDSHIASATSAFITSGDIPTQKELSAGEGISITETEDKFVIATSGIPSGSIQYSALNWVDYGDQNVVTSIQGQGDYNYIFSSRYAGWADYAGSASYDSIGRPLSSISGGKTYTSPSGTLLIDNENSVMDSTTSGLLLTEHFVYSAVNVNMEAITSIPTTGVPYKIVDNIISGKISADPYGGSLDYNTSAWVKDSDGNTLTSFVIPRLGHSESYTIPYTSTSAGNSLWIKASDYYIGEANYVGAVYSSVPVTGYEVVDLWDNYSAGPGISINDHVISAAGSYSGVAPVYVDNINNVIGISAAWKLSAGDGVSFTVDEPTNTLTVNAEGGCDRNYYSVSTPATSYTAEGDLTFKYQASQSTPSRIYARIGSADVGLLAPTDVVSRGMLVTNYMGGVYWTAQSAIIPKDASAYAGYYTRTYTTADNVQRIAPGSGYPTMDHDWTFNVINQGSASIEYDMDGHGATATLDPGYGIRLHYDVDDNNLDAEPEYPLGGDSYCTNYETMDGYKIRAVATSADIGNEWNIIYIVTGGNN